MGNKIPIRIDETLQTVFRELGQQFRVLPGQGPDLDAIFTEAGQSIFRPGPDQAAYESLSAQFERLARRAMASLTFRFADTSRAVYYWLVLLRQQIKPSSTWALRQVCLASADLCSELETQAHEAGVRAKSRVSSPSETKEDAVTVPSCSGIKPLDESNPEVSTILLREKMLASYKAATGNPSNAQIYSAKNSSIHKPEFYAWRQGKLPATSQTTINFERFLTERKAPVPKAPRH